jgi:hypothetical protein
MVYSKVRLLGVLSVVGLLLNAAAANAQTVTFTPGMNP